MPPWSIWWRGAETLARLRERRGGRVPSRPRPVPCRANGQAALAYYSLDAETGRYRRVRASTC